MQLDLPPKFINTTKKNCHILLINGYQRKILRQIPNLGIKSDKHTIILLRSSNKSNRANFNLVFIVLPCLCLCDRFIKLPVNFVFSGALVVSSLSLMDKLHENFHRNLPASITKIPLLPFFSLLLGRILLLFT